MAACFYRRLLAIDPFAGTCSRVRAKGDSVPGRRPPEAAARIPGSGVITLGLFKPGPIATFAT